MKRNNSCPQPADKQMGSSLAAYLFCFFSCCFLLLSASLISPQAHSAPVIILNGQQGDIPLTDYVDILDDANNEYQAKDVLQLPLALEFSPINLESRELLKDYSHTFWLRFSISNTTDQERHLWLHANDAAVAKLQIYVWDNAAQVPRMLESASIQQPYLSPILKTLTIPANSTRLYTLKANTIQQHTFDLALTPPTDYFMQSIAIASQFSASLGILLTMTLFCYIIAVYRSSLIFLHHGHYIGALLFVQLIGLGVSRNWYPNFAEWQYAAIFCFFYLANASALHTAQHYLKSHGCYDSFRSAIHFGLNLNFISFFVLLFWVDSYSPLIWMPIAITTPIVLSASYYCYRKTQHKVAYWITWVRFVSASFYGISVFYRFDSFGLHQIIDPLLLSVLIVESFSIGILLLIHEFERFSQEGRNNKLLHINETKQQAQNQLLSEVSHDLRSPISGILGMADLLKNSHLSPTQLEHIEAIRSSGQALLNKVSELHQRVQLQQGELAEQKAPFELALLIEECVSGFQLQAEERNLELILSIQPDVPVIVEGNAIYLRQILLQLIDNAVKYTAQGEVIIQISRQASRPRFIHFSIRDTGRGISKQQLNQLQSSSAIADIEMNRPFGLPVVTSLLQQLKSQLHIHSELGEGSEFSFDLLLPATQLSDNSASEDLQILQGKRLLIVDDNHTCCKVLKQQASSWGMQVKEAYDGNEALAIFRAKKNLDDPFDAIIVDYDMPHLSGVQVAEKILEETDQPPVIIMLTGLSLTPPETITRQAGIEVVLNKPASQKLIRLTLSNLFHLHDRQQTDAEPEARTRVLIAEDNDVSRRVISKMMERLNVDFKLASDGQLALDAIKREHFDMILMDCEMPIMDGFDATQAIHDWQLSRHQPLTPVVALTAHVLGEHKARSETVGMVDYLEKPVQMAELEAILRKWTEQ